MSLSDYFQRDESGDCILSIVAARGELLKIFSVENWVGHLQDMRQLWAAVPATAKKQVDISNVEHQIIQRRMHEAAAKDIRARTRLSFG